MCTEIDIERANNELSQNLCQFALKHKKAYRSFVEDIRKQQRVASVKEHNTMVEEHNSTCDMCGCSCKDILELHFRIPLYLGGMFEDLNMAVLCPNCHSIIHKFIDPVFNPTKNEYNSELEEVDKYVCNHLPKRANDYILEEIVWIARNRSKFSIYELSNNFLEELNK